MMFNKPCNGLITSLYDKARKNPVTGKVQPHWGIDYGNTPDRNDIFASASGKVRIAVNSSTGFGKYVVIIHDNGWESLYAHLSVISVSAGREVAQGQKIGVKGTTGNSTGIHLHFEISKGKWTNKYTQHVNPALHINDPDVRHLQLSLNKIGYKVTVDGLYGDGLVTAVFDFQKKNKLVADGVAGRVTMESVEKAAKVILVAQDKPTSTPAPPKKEETRMFKPSSTTLKTAYEQFLTGAIKDGTIADKWLTDFKADKLSLDDALALKVIVDQRNK